MAPKLFPDFQTFLDTRDGDTIGVTKVTMVTSDDHVILPNATDARVLVGTYGATPPNFYLAADQNRFNIADSNAGVAHTIVSRHRRTVNFNSET